MKKRAEKMKIFKWFAIVVVIVVSIPVVIIGASYIRNKTIGPAGWAEDNTEKRLKAMMKDPDSMVVRSSYIVQVEKEPGKVEIAVCGVVDGKNGFGGYTGGTRFVSVSSDNKKTETFDTYIVEMDTATAADRSTEKARDLTPFEKVYWNGHCVDASHSALTPSA